MRAAGHGRERESAAVPISRRSQVRRAHREHEDKLTSGKDGRPVEVYRFRPSTRRETAMQSNAAAVHREPWNKGKIIGQKAPFKLKDIWALRIRLQMESRVRELALFNLGIDSKLRGCDLVALRVRDVCDGDQVATRAVVMQHKTQRPVQFEITAATREAVQA